MMLIRSKPSLTLCLWQWWRRPGGVILLVEGTIVMHHVLCIGSLGCDGGATSVMTFLEASDLESQLG
jgi:hypothetical protein